MLASGMMIACLLLTDAPPAARPGAEPLRARWIGQDGHDFVGPSTDLKPNDVQDMHLVLSGLPPGREVAEMIVKGHGGGDWPIKPRGESWGAVLRRARGSRAADLFLEPVRDETGRSFYIKITYDDGSTAECYAQGGAAGLDRRMPLAALAVQWIGQDRHDRVGSGPSVGPDGLQDIHLALKRLSPRVEIKSVAIDAKDGRRWQYGTNLKGDSNAELIRDPKDPARAELFFQADRDLLGQTLTLTLTYATGKTDSARVAAGRVDPALRMPPSPLPSHTFGAVTGRWLGQDGSQDAGPGTMHIALSGLSPNRPIVGAVLTDSVRGVWAFRADDRVKVEGDVEEQPLIVKRGTERTRADLYFAPVRDESKTALTLRLVEPSGALSVAKIAGGPCAVAARSGTPAASSIVARPGADLNDLANRHGTVRLEPGTYTLTKPLVLERPVTISAGPGTTLLFSQAPGDPEWSTAIKIHAGNTTLEGFAVRFAGPIRWNQGVSYGPAVIGVTENTEGNRPDPKYGLAFNALDLEIPPITPAPSGGWTEALRLFRLVGARGGKITRCVLRGGLAECFGGPWEFTDNDYRGTLPGTFTHGVFVVHDPHDVIIRGNRAKPVGPSGKTWRFLVLTGRGYSDRIEGNTIESIGPRDDDSIPSMNAPEIILTESYHVHFEGKLAALSADGRLMTIPRPQGTPARSGEVVSVLAGPHAGQWRLIAQTLAPDTYLLDTPLPRGVEIVSITPGYIRATFQNNTIDARGSKTATCLVLAGNHFGVKVRANRLSGGEAFRLLACASESPVHWGWTHVPMLDCVVEGNTIEDAELGGVLGVEHHPTGLKSNKGRTYMTLTLRDNLLRWTAPFLKRHPLDAPGTRPPGLIVGFPDTLDPAELIVRAKGNRCELAEGVTPGVASVRVRSALLNGKAIVDRAFPLPALDGLEALSQGSASTKEKK